MFGMSIFCNRRELIMHNQLLWIQLLISKLKKASRFDGSLLVNLWPSQSSAAQMQNTLHD